MVFWGTALTGYVSKGGVVKQALMSVPLATWYWGIILIVAQLGSKIGPRHTTDLGLAPRVDLHCTFRQNFSAAGNRIVIGQEK
jgi:hypothetical protein